MLDPGLEHMHRHGRLWRASIELRRLRSEAILDGLLLVPIVLLFVFAPGGHWASPWLVVLLVGASAVTNTVRFDIGAGSTSPMQLVWIPLWFAVPPAWIPVLLGVSMALAGLIEHFRDHEQTPVWTALFKAGDAWPTLGPAIVLALAGPHAAELSIAWLVALAFMAQLAVDFSFTILSQKFLHGVPVGTQVRVMLWIAAIDAALAPVGFLIAIVMVTQPIAVVAAFPLIAVVAEFARERKDRLEQALQLSNAYRGTAQLMGDVLEADDAYTGGEHTQGVVNMAVAVGLELRLTPREMRDLEFGALLHDIGKLRIPNEVINKPGGLDAAEWEMIRRHPVYGQEMLNRVGGAMTDAGRIVRAHHERWDGLGYPDRLAGDEIPLAARIITACDSFSAMTTTRSYSPAMPHEAGLAELARCSGSQFDPGVVSALVTVLERDPELCGSQGRSALGALSPVAAALGLRPLT
jgi:hypothetical protein